MFSSCSFESERQNNNEFLPVTDIEYPKELELEIVKIQNLLRKHNKPLIKNLIIRYSSNKTFDYENEARGLCIKVNPTPIIYLLEKDWIGESAKSKDIQELSLIHLIGHCVYNLNHNEKVTTHKEEGKAYKHPTSLMVSRFSWQNFSPYFLEKKKQEYQIKIVNNFFEKEIN